VAFEAYRCRCLGLPSHAGIVFSARTGKESQLAPLKTFSRLTTTQVAHC
jgi:hypothetical protein